MSEYSIGHLKVESPFANAGGVVKHVEDVEVMARTGVGWIECGSYTLEPRTGNSPNGEVVYYHDPKTGETFNSLGMPNKGIDIVEKEIPAMVEIAHKLERSKPLVVNIAPVSDEPTEECLELFIRANEAGADAVIINAGCPNVVTADGGRHEILSRDESALYKVLCGLRKTVQKYPKVFIRVSPQESRQAAMRILSAIEYAGTVSAIFAPNTWPGNRPLNLDNKPILEVPGGVGGKSGPATASEALEQTVWFAARGKFDVVSSGGIASGKELAKRLVTTEADLLLGDKVKSERLRYLNSQDIGHAAVAGASTTFFYESGDWKHDVDKLLWQFSESI